MTKYMKNFITLAGLILIGSFLVFLHSCIVSLSGFVAQLSPVLAPWIYWLLLLAVGGMLGRMVVVAFLRPKPMLVYAEPTDADMVTFKAELVRRLKKNRHLRDAEIVINDENDIDGALIYLRELADQEIKSTARRVFITTGISQNGRLDSLVVFFLVTRLVWRLIKLYNQRPQYRELTNLYANIAITSFVAGSIEEFGVDEYVHELMGPLIGGSAIGTVPGAQAIAGTITASILDGTTNCLMTLRCGIVARDYLSLKLDAKNMRRSATAEASRIFMSMSSETVVFVTKALAKGAADVVRTGSSRAVKSVGGAIANTAESVSEGVRKVGNGVKGAAGTVGGGAKGLAEAIGSGAKETADFVVSKVRKAGEVVGTGTPKVVHNVKEAAVAAGKGAQKIGHGTKHAANTVGNGVRKAGRSMKSTVRSVGLTKQTGKDGETPPKGGEKTTYFLKATRQKINEKASSTAQTMDRLVTNGKKTVGNVFDRLKRFAQRP